MVVAFPPCTDLSWASGRLIHAKRADGRTDRAADFALQFLSWAPLVAIENPSHGDLRRYLEPSQIIDPWQFGDPYLKSTALWLKGLPLLTPSITIRPVAQRWVSTGPYGPSRGVARTPRGRARTFPGIADAMSTQWAGTELDMEVGL